MLVMISIREDDYIKRMEKGTFLKSSSAPSEQVGGNGGDVLLG